MSLMLHNSAGRPLQHNMQGTPSPGAPGTNVIASATLHTKGSWTQLIASTNFDVYGITLIFSGDGSAGAYIANLYDLGIGSSGFEVPIVSNIPNAAANAGTTPGPIHFLPIFIPKGTRIVARHQSNVASKSSSVVLFLHGGFSLPPWRFFSGADVIGSDTADSGGTSHVPGSAGAESAWANIGVPLARQYFAMKPLMTTGNDITMTNNLGHLEFGIAGVSIAEYGFTTLNTEAIGHLIPNIPFYGNFPMGTQMQIRATIGSTPDDDYEFALMGFY